STIFLLRQRHGASRRFLPAFRLLPLRNSTFPSKRSHRSKKRSTTPILILNQTGGAGRMSDLHFAGIIRSVASFSSLQRAQAHAVQTVASTLATIHLTNAVGDGDCLLCAVWLG